jgi:uncharacterized protein
MYGREKQEKMKKNTTKRKRQTSRKSQKQKAVQTLMVLGIILVLSIVLLLLIPDTTIIGTGDSGQQPYTQKTPGPEPGKTKKESLTDTEPVMEKTPVPGGSREMQPDNVGKIAVVIDDAGNNIRDLLPFLQFPFPLTIAVLPQLPGSRDAALLSSEAGKEVILHLPMEAEGGANPGPGALYETDSKQEIIQTIIKNLATVPGAMGANNHMGSKLTANPGKMSIVFEYFAEQDLFFLDSRTTGRTVCREEASRAGIPFLERNIFLDYKQDKEVIREQMEKGIALAQKNEYVILIGHVQNSEVLDILYEVLPEVEQNHGSFVGLSEIIGK